MSSQIIDLEEDRSFNLVKLVQEKDMIIEELNKKIRFLKFEQEKNIKTYLEEIADLKEKIKNNEQNTKINTYEQIVEELEKNLTKTENELLKNKEIETDLKTQFYNLKSENSVLRAEIEKFLKFKDEIEELRSMRQNFEELEVKIKETAVEAIMEKENELILLRERFLEVEAVSEAKIDSLNNQINDLQHKLFSSGIFLRDSNEISFEPTEAEKFREEKEKLLREFTIERAELTERIELLSLELEKEVTSYQQNQLNYEKEQNERIFQKLKEQMEASSKSEYNLIEELQKYDEKLKIYEIKTKDYEKKLSQNEERYQKSSDAYKKKIDELEKNLLDKNDEMKSNIKFEYQINQMKEEYEAKLQQNFNVIKSLEKLKDKDMQKILNLEGENKKISKNMDQLKQTILKLENNKNDLEDKLRNTIEEYDDKLYEINKQKEKANSELQIQKKMIRPSNIYNKITDEMYNIGSELKPVNEIRPSINISPCIMFSTELKDFPSEDNWQTDMKELLVELTSSKNAAKKKFDFPKLKFSDYDVEKEKIDPPIFSTEKTPRLGAINVEKITKLEKELSELQKENVTLKLEFQEANKNLLQEIEKTNMREAEITKNNQQNRRQTLEGLKKFPPNFLENMQLQNQGQGYESIEKAIQQLENLNNEKKEIEGKFYKLKREYEEEKIFLENELKKTEETAVEAKLQYAIIATEKDYFEHEHKLIIQELKRKNINIDYNEKKKNGGFMGKLMLCGFNT